MFGVTEELEWGDTSILLQVIPLLEGDTPNGALLLMRDVSELRRRDRMLLSKDATIREIHHRVKNNLQTIASLLRLQGRRLSSPEAKQALEESVRRIRSIALVHETLAYEAGNTVPFGEIIRPLVRVVEDGLTSPDRHIRFAVEGLGSGQQFVAEGIHPSGSPYAWRDDKDLFHPMLATEVPTFERGTWRVLPVHAGWTLGSISRCSVSPSLPQVDRIWNLVPSVMSTLIM